jgi:hypothetical protein
MVAERLTKAVQKAYSPAIETAKLVALERRRANEMARTAQTLGREKKELQERLQALYKHLAPVMELATLAKDEFVQLVLQVQERVKALTAERERAAKERQITQEKQRRIDDLPRVKRTTAGAAHTFAKHAIEAIAQEGGFAHAVEWPKVERMAIRDALRDTGQSPQEVLGAIVRHSPGMADPARQEAARAYISELAGKEIVPVSSNRVQKERDRGPSL